MRILIAVHGLPGPGAGGTELYAFACARRLVERHGAVVLLLARENDPGRPEYAMRREDVNGVSTVRVNNTFGSLRAFSETYANPALDAVAEPIVDTFKPDVAHVHHLSGLSTGLVAVLADRGVPCVFTLHDYWLMCHRGQLLDVDGQVCDGPGATGCESCLGLAGSSGRAGFAGAALVRDVERRLPAGSARFVRMMAEGVGRLLSDPAVGVTAARERVEHMRGVCACESLSRAFPGDARSIRALRRARLPHCRCRIRCGRGAGRTSGAARG